MAPSISLVRPCHPLIYAVIAIALVSTVIKYFSNFFTFLFQLIFLFPFCLKGALRNVSSPNACCQWRAASPYSWIPLVVLYVTIVVPNKRANHHRKFVIGKRQTNIICICHNVCSVIVVAQWVNSSMRKVKR